MQFYFSLINTYSQHYTNYRDTGSIVSHTSPNWIKSLHIKEFNEFVDTALDQAIDVAGAYVYKRYKDHIDEQSKIRRKPGATGPRHLDSSKIKVLKLDARNGFTFDIDIPGIRRAYHPITIIPRKSKYLAIPLKPQYGAARTFPKDLFFYKTKAGNKALAYVSSGKLVVTHILKESVFQPRDPTLLPKAHDVGVGVSLVAGKVALTNLKFAVENFGSDRFKHIYRGNNGDNSRRYATGPMLALYLNRLTSNFTQFAK